MPDAQAWFEINSERLGHKEEVQIWHVHIGQKIDPSFWAVLVEWGSVRVGQGPFGANLSEFFYIFLKMGFHQIWAVIYGLRASSTGLRPANFLSFFQAHHPPI